MNIPLYLIITKPNVPKYEIINFNCTSLEDCENKLIVHFKKLIMTKIIDYPLDVDDFITIYYSEYSMDNIFFDYNIFHDNEWKKILSLQELYDKVLNIIYEVDIQNSIYNDKNYYDYCSDDDNKQDEFNNKQDEISNKQDEISNKQDEFNNKDEINNKQDESNK